MSNLDFRDREIGFVKARAYGVMVRFPNGKNVFLSPTEELIGHFSAAGREEKRGIVGGDYDSLVKAVRKKEGSKNMFTKETPIRFVTRRKKGVKRVHTERNYVRRGPYSGKYNFNFSVLSKMGGRKGRLARHRVGCNNIPLQGEVLSEKFSFRCDCRDYHVLGLKGDDAFLPDDHFFMAMAALGKAREEVIHEVPLDEQVYKPRIDFRTRLKKSAMPRIFFPGINDFPVADEGLAREALEKIYLKGENLADVDLWLLHDSPWVIEDDLFKMVKQGKARFEIYKGGESNHTRIMGAKARNAATILEDKKLRGGPFEPYGIVLEYPGRETVLGQGKFSQQAAWNSHRDKFDVQILEMDDGEVAFGVRRDVSPDKVGRMKAHPDCNKGYGFYINRFDATRRDTLYKVCEVGEIEKTLKSLEGYSMVFGE